MYKFYLKITRNNMKELAYLNDNGNETNISI